MISIVIPSYNEENNIENIYKEIKNTACHFKDEYEVIFIDDGSQDHTIDKIKECSLVDDHIKYISFSRNFGKEAAMYAGLKYSKGDYVIIMDSDLQHPPKLIPQLIDKAKEGYDQVIAKRNRVGDDGKKTFLSDIYYKLVNKMVDVKLENGVGDFRVLSRKAVNAILSMQEYSRFSKGIFSWIGFKTTKIEYENVIRESGESKWSIGKLFKYALDGIMSFNDKPLRIIIYFGMMTTFLGVLYLIYSFIRILIIGVEAPGYFTTIFAILFMGGVQLISIGILGEYIGKIYYEVKKRPKYLVNETNIEDSNF